MDLNTCSFGLFDRSAETLVLHLIHIGEAQRPLFIILDSLHERISDTDRNIKVGNLILVDLSGNEIFDIRVIDTQHRHIRTAASSALRDLTEGVIVHTQEANRSRGLPRGSLN